MIADCVSNMRYHVAKVTESQMLFSELLKKQWYSGRITAQQLSSEKLLFTILVADSTRVLRESTINHTIHEAYDS